MQVLTFAAIEDYTCVTLPTTDIAAKLRQSHESLENSRVTYSIVTFCAKVT